MQEVIQTFEQTAQGLAPVTLVIPGLVLLLSGICLWLGGLKLAKLIFLILGAAAGGLWLISMAIDCGFCEDIKKMVSEISVLVSSITRIVIDEHATGVLIAAACGVGAIVLVFFLPRLTAAVIFGVIGTVVIFAAMILLLLNKGSQPMSHVYMNGGFYATAAVAMTVFGGGVQLLLCPRKKKKVDNEKDDKGDKK